MMPASAPKGFFYYTPPDKTPTKVKQRDVANHVGKLTRKSMVNRIKVDSDWIKAKSLPDFAPLFAASELASVSGMDVVGHQASFCTRQRSLIAFVSLQSESETESESESKSESESESASASESASDKGSDSGSASSSSSGSDTGSSPGDDSSESESGSDDSSSSSETPTPRKEGNKKKRRKPRKKGLLDALFKG
jgi:cobalamin biosynthesis protein CobT